MSDKSKKGYRKLFVWQKADDLAYEVYIATKQFPRDEMFGIVSQLRRAALSIAVNLVEGAGRQNRREIKQFANISLGSMAETEYLLAFALRLGYLSDENYSRLEGKRQEAGNLLQNKHQSKHH